MHGLLSFILDHINVFLYSSFNTGITNSNGVCTLAYHCETDKTLTATYSNASATASIVSNYTPAYTGAMDYTLAQNILIVPTSVATTAQLSMCSITGMPVEWMEGWLLDDTTIPSLNTSVPSSDLGGFISEAEEVPNLYNMGDSSPQILEVSASSFASGVDITQFTTPPDYFNYDYAQGLLYIIFIDYQGQIHKVDYSATDSTHLTCTVTNTIIE